MITYQAAAARVYHRREVEDWRRDVVRASTPLGAVTAWSRSLQSAAALVFAQRHPMLLYWGSDLLCLMDLAARRLGSDGQFVSPAEMAWPECWQRVQRDILHVVEARR